MSELTVGGEFAGYRVDALVGRGGMGVIYRGTDPRLRRPVAIKLIASHRAGDDRFRRRFEREARLTAALEHPNVIPIYGAGEEDGHLYLVMRYVAGTDLATLLKARGRLSPARAAQIAGQVAQALDAAHAAGLVHRDIKPANVLLAGDHIYLSDFGITRAADSGSRVTDSGQWLGTVDFSSPEHLRGERVDARSDVYALGCLLHAALTGEPPYRRDTVAATILAHLTDPPPRPSTVAGIPPPFDDVIARALAKSPGERYPSAGDLARAARAAAAGRSLAMGREHSVARGPAAPEVKVPKAKVSEPRDTEIDWRPQPGPELPFPRRRRPALRSVGVAVAVCAAGAAVVAAIFLAFALVPHTAPRPAVPLTTAQVTGAVDAFATAYGDRDPGALADVLAPAVQRVSPGGVQRGRSAVLAAYAKELTDSSITGYRLERLQVQRGWAGRASAEFQVLRSGRPGSSGRVVFAVVALGGRAEIALIATEPAG